MASRTIFAVGAAALVASALVGCSGSGGKSSAPAMTRRHTETSTFLPPIYPGTTVSFPPSTSGSAAPSASSASPSPSGLPARALPGDGTFRMGADLRPGTYRSEGGESCYWERLRGLGGQTADIIANGAGILPQTVTIAPTDLAFRSQGCAPWTLTSGGTTTTTSTTTSTTPVTLPPGAQACPATAAPAGGLTTSAVGSSGTSCPFAEAVRLAYAASGPISTAPRQVYAASPVTKQQYALTCAASGSLVVCNGGSDAVVYLY
jgi:hypothetical protein